MAAIMSGCRWGCMIRELAVSIVLFICALLGDSLCMGFGTRLIAVRQGCSLPRLGLLSWLLCALRILQ